jgi:hypothetical protein
VKLRHTQSVIVSNSDHRTRSIGAILIQTQVNSSPKAATRHQRPSCIYTSASHVANGWLCTNDHYSGVYFNDISLAARCKATGCAVCSVRSRTKLARATITLHNALVAVAALVIALARVHNLASITVVGVDAA